MRYSLPGTSKLRNYWHATRQDHFATATSAGISDALAAGYKYVRSEGYLFTNGTTGSTPVWLYWHAGRGDNFTTSTLQGMWDAMQAGYQFIRVEGDTYWIEP